LGPARDLLRESVGWSLDTTSGSKTLQSKTYSELTAEIEVLREREDDEKDKSGNEVVAANAVSHGLISAIRRRRSWKTRRTEHAPRKMATWSQKWLTSFAHFLTNYSGIVEIIKGADSSYGGLAYGVLSVLVAVPLHKSQHEMDVEEALNEFALAFPRLQNLKDIYPERSETLKRLVASVYAEVVRFARECVLYFEASSISKSCPGWFPDSLAE
jgi:hypothetical protein